MTAPITHAKLQKLKEKMEGKPAMEPKVELGEVTVSVTDEPEVIEETEDTTGEEE